MANDHVEYEPYPNIEYKREQGRGSDGKFYFKLDAVRCEYGGFYSAETAASTLALTVPAGKILHIRTLSGLTTASNQAIQLREGSAAGNTIYRLAVEKYEAPAQRDLVGLLASADIYVQMETMPTMVGLFIGGVLDPNPSRE